MGMIKGLMETQYIGKGGGGGGGTKGKKKKILLLWGGKYQVAWKHW
jgi:hypothetical protein